MLCATWKVAHKRLQIYKKEYLLMNNIIYIVGAIVIVVAILSFLGLR